jgi:DNA-binding NarL/FixJ family response regulator
VVSDVRIVREGLAEAIDRQLGEAEAYAEPSVAEALASARDGPADTVVIDMSMYGALEGAKEFALAVPDVKVIAFSVSDSDPSIIAYVEAGIVGFVPREGSVQDLVATIESVRRGEARVSPRLARSMMQRLAIAGGAGSGPQLTSREREIAVLIEEGLSNKEIARRLCIELATVKNHVHHILEKMQVRRRAQAAAAVRRARYPRVPPRA